MYSTYCMGSDVEMNRMFDQYLFKGTESFDLSLSIPDSAHHHHHDHHHHSGNNNYNTMSSDQTFHTPSFGDEEFEIPPISLPPSTSESNTDNNMSSQQGFNSSVMTHATMGGEQVSVITIGGAPLTAQTMAQPAQMMAANNQQMVNASQQQQQQQQQMMGQQAHYATHNMYLQQMGEGGSMMTTQPDSGSSQSFETQPTYTLSSHQQQQQQAPPPRLIIQQQSQQQQQQQQQQQLMGTTLLTTINQQQQPQMVASQQQMQFMPPRAPSTSGSPPGSTQTSPSLHETSEDSDDSASQMGGNTPLHQLMGGIKRPSPEPVDTKMVNITKKAKVPKKKKKRDPNEPQKPVSAYALFFRDTQAAIKGQNPNASFGEVSKIVASMWDSLDADHKNVYKKKTEAAKKEYLKALAAYRASLVSKQSTPDQMEAMYGSGGGPPQYNASGSYPQTTAISSSTVMMATTLSQTMPPLQQHPQMQQQSLQQHPTRPVSAGSGYPPPSSYQPQQTSLSAGGGGNQQVQQQQQQQQQPMASPQGVASSQPQLQQRSTTCLRNGCPNPAVESPDWDSEYCRTFLLPGWLPARLPILLPQ